MRQLQFGYTPVRHFTICASFALLGLLSACSGDSGQKTGNANPAPIVDEDDTFGVVYNGPLPGTSDVNNFKIAFWDNIAAENRCGGCHIQADQSPQFARSDDVNLAYTAANGIVNLTDPASSAIVSKVASGHNCWSSDNKFCEEKLTEWITNWASTSGVEVTQTALREPDKLEVSASLVFPESASQFETLVYTPILKKYCADCHRGDAPQAPVQPYFSSSNPESAYDASQTKMLFNVTTNDAGTEITNIDASRSRFVLRLREEAHNCWGNDCVAAAAAMEAALEAFAATMNFVGLDDTLVTSKAMRIGDGTAISQGGRTETNAIAVYPFKAGSGSIANDYSDGFPPALDLNLMGVEDGGVEWVSNWGVRISGGHVIGPVAGSKKIQRYVTQTGEFSIETWVIPANVTQDGPARIVSYSGSDAERNFTLGQTLYNYNFLNRSSVTDENGGPMLSTPDAAEVLQATLQHVVVSYDLIEGRKIYVNGDLIVNEDPEGGGALNEWDETFALILGNETSGNYPWKGTIRFLAIHNRALTPEQVQGNYDVGVGQKILVAFAIDHLIDDMDDAYIVFQVEQFDDYSYLFNNPYFFSFTETPSSDIEIKGLRIGINGREADVGQAYANLNISIKSSDFVAEGVPISSLGTVIALEKGSSQDQFFLGFDSIEGRNTGRPAVVVPEPPAAEFLDESQPRIAVRTFAEINASLSAMTGIPVTHSDVMETFSGPDGVSGVQQQMPSDENIGGFLVAHQMGITQLSVKYCNVLATEGSRMSAFFPSFSGNRFDAAGRSALIDPLLKALVAHNIDSEGAQLANQPLTVDSNARLNDLIDIMTSSCSGDVCSDLVTDNTVTTVCAAALGSAVMLIQ